MPWISSAQICYRRTTWRPQFAFLANLTIPIIIFRHSQFIIILFSLTKIISKILSLDLGYYESICLYLFLCAEQNSASKVCSNSLLMHSILHFKPLNCSLWCPEHFQFRSQFFIFDFFQGAISNLALVAIFGLEVSCLSGNGWHLGYFMEDFHQRLLRYR